MSFGPYSHPEFGYFCPPPRLRRDVRVACLAVMFGALIGSVTVAVLRTNRDAQLVTTAGIENGRVAVMKKAPDAATRSDSRFEIGSRAADPVRPSVDFEKSQPNL